MTKAEKGTSKNPDGSTELACLRDDNAFSQPQSRRHQELWKKLQDNIQDVHELSDGYALGFPGTNEVLLELAEFVSLERLCCSFFTFNLEFTGTSGPITLSLTGQGGVKEFLAQEFGPG